MPFYQATFLLPVFFPPSFFFLSPEILPSFQLFGLDQSHSFWSTFQTCRGQAPLPDHPDLPRATAASLAFLEDRKELKKNAPFLLPQGFSGDPTPTQMLVVSRILKCTPFPLFISTGLWCDSKGSLSDQRLEGL